MSLILPFLLVLAAEFIVITCKSHAEFEQITADWLEQSNKTILSHWHYDVSTDLFGDSIFITLIMS